MPLSGHPCSDSFSFERGHPLLVETEEMNFEKDPKLRIQVELGEMESRLHLEEFAISLWRTQSQHDPGDKKATPCICALLLSLSLLLLF